MVSTKLFSFTGMIDKVFNQYKTYLQKSKGLVGNTKKNFSQSLMISLK